MPITERDKLRGWLRVAGLHATVFAVYALFVWLGIALGSGSFNVSPVWPAIGFAVGVVRMFGYSLVPTVALSDLVAATIYAGDFVPVDVPNALVAAAAAALGAFLLRRFAPTFGEPGTDVGATIRFLVFPCIGAALASALAGMAVLAAFKDPASVAFGATLQTWWLGDAVGIVVTTPLVLACLVPDQRWMVQQRPVEAGLVVVATLVATLATLASDLGRLVPLIEPSVVMLPFLVWGALRFGVAGAAACNLLVAVGVTSTAAAGLGPFGADDGGSPLGLQFLVGVLGPTILLLGATASRRDYLQRMAQRQTDFVASITQNLPGAVFRQRIGRDGRLEFPYIAGRLAATLGLRAGGDADPIAQTVESASKGARLDPSDQDSLVAALERGEQSGEPVQMDLRIHGHDGRLHWGRAIARPASDERGGTTWDGLLLDVTEEKEQRERVDYLARHDALTGLLNRHGLQEQLSPLLARARQQQRRVGFCLVDLDGFKAINDGYGHAAGDRVLQTLGERLNGVVQQENLKARLGGDEFLLVQLDAGEQGSLERICDRVLDSLGALIDGGEHRLRVSVSMGVAVYPDDGDTVDAVLAAADQALYAAKTRERGNLVFHGPDLGPVSQRGRLELGRDLARAIDQDELAAYYQPQVDITSGRVVGAEALARWHHPERGWISPAEFVPLAEQTGLAAALDRVILRRALAEVGGHHNNRVATLRLSANVSGASMRDASHRRRVADDLLATGVVGERLELELTETTLAQAIDEDIGRALADLTRTGLGLAIDDFGTGYGSLTYLRNLPIARIKIDRTFVHGMAHRSRDRAIVRALVALADDLGLGTVAEGVETRAQLEAVRAAGCTICQGFCFAPALAPAEFTAFVEQHGIAGA